MTYFDFRGLIFSLERMGLLDVILPFLLIFTVIFAVLQKSKILDGGDATMMKKYNVVVALVMAFAVVIPHVTGAYRGFTSPVDIINNALPAVSVVLIAIVMFLLLIGVFGKQLDIGADGGVGGFVTLVAVGTVGTIFAISAGWLDRGLPRWLDFLRDPQLQALIVVIVVFGLLIKFITAEEKETKDDEGLNNVLIKSLKDVGKD